jgi:predicted ATPase/DNA-binding SARP family transcriptional activator
MKFSLLGPLEVREGDQVILLGGAKQRALLAALLLHPNEVVSRDRLIDGVWGEQPPATAAHTVETYVSRLRRALHDTENHDVLVTRPPGYMLRIDPEQFDLKRFERLVWEGRRELAEGNPRAGSELLRQALALFRGPPLDDVAFFPFARAEVDRLEEMRLAALEDRMDADLAAGRSAELVAELEALVSTFPIRERLRAQLMVALYRAGRQADALEAYRRTRQYLVEELGVEPSATLRRLEQRILLHDPSLEAVSPEAESVVSSVYSSVEPATVVEAAPPIAPSVNVNLPRPASSFVGREREVREVASRLRKRSRLLTLSGPGGSGKTRLAIESAFELASDFRDGVFWVALDPLRDPALVTETVAQTLGASHGLAEHVGEREMLLLLDNFEHVIEAAPELSPLLEACPNLKLLVTSREVLRIRGEAEYQVPPLSDPEAVELFCARSGLAPSGAIAELSRRLDSLPLAIELAAARTSVLTPAEILERISKHLDLFKGGRDAEDRHQTLRATIEWSYDLLNEEEKALFARLSVFAGGCTFLSAEEVAHADLDVLQSLVDKSLLRHSDDRFWMLNTIRGYGAERLAESRDGDELRQRHAEHFLKLVESAPGLRTSSALSANVADTSAWRDQIQPDYDNVRAALAWFREAGDLEGEFRLVFPITWLFLWVHRGGMREAGHMYEGILSKGDQVQPQIRVDALHSLAHFGTYLARETRRQLAEQSLSLARVLGDKGRIEWALRRLALRQDDREEARRMLLECETLARDLREEARLAWIQQALGVIALAHDDLEDARRRLEESVSIFERIKGKWQATYALSSLAALTVLQERFDDARPLLIETLRRAFDLRMPNHAAQCLDNVAGVALADGNAALATRLLAAATSVREQTGDRTTEGEDWFDYELRMRARTRVATRKRLGTGFAREWKTGEALTLNEAVGLALDSLLSSEQGGQRTSQMSDTSPG